MSDRITTETTENNGQLFEQIEIENTPFTAIKLDEEWFLTMGKYRLSQKLQSLEECIEQSKDASWHRIMQIIAIMVTESEEVRELRQSIKEIHEHTQH